MRRRWFLLVLALLVCVPPFIEWRWASGEGVHLRPPSVWSGDEPHYLVMIHSLIEDGDLDLANNYASVHSGSDEAGRKFAGSPLDHHVAIYFGGRFFYWADVYDGWQRDAQGHTAGHPRDWARARPDFAEATAAEYSFHPPGLALLLAPWLLPWRGTPYVEPAAVFLSAVALFFTALAIAAMLEALGVSETNARLAALLAVCGSPLWHYGRTLFSEPWLALCSAGAFAVYLRGVERPAAARTSALLAGLFIAAGMLMKPPFALLALPLLAHLAVRRRDASAILALGAPMGLAAAAILSMNAFMFGGPWRGPQPFLWGEPLAGMAGLLVSPLHGLLAVSPLALAGVAGSVLLIKRHGSMASLPAAGAVLYYLLMASWDDWPGGRSYGPRLIVPILPLLYLGIGECLQRWPALSRGGRALFVLIAVVSVVINLLAVVCYQDAYVAHPLARFFG